MNTPNNPNALKWDLLTPYARIRARVYAAGSNMSELCRRAGITRPAAEHWKNNQDCMTADTLRKVIAAIEQIEGTASPSELPDTREALLKLL